MLKRHLLTPAAGHAEHFTWELNVIDSQKKESLLKHVRELEKKWEFLKSQSALDVSRKESELWDARMAIGHELATSYIAIGPLQLRSHFQQVIGICEDIPIRVRGIVIQVASRSKVMVTRQIREGDDFTVIIPHHNGCMELLYIDHKEHNRLLLVTAYTANEAKAFFDSYQR